MIALLAHQGGWDEILLVLGPIAVIIGLLKLAKNRVDRTSDTQPTHDVEPTHDTQLTHDVEPTHDIHDER